MSNHQVYRVRTVIESFIVAGSRREAERAAEQERKDREEYARLSAKFGKKGTKR